VLTCSTTPKQKLHCHSGGNLNNRGVSQEHDNVDTTRTKFAHAVIQTLVRGRALNVGLRNNERALLPLIPSWLAALNHKDSSMRAFFAHALYENVGKIEDRMVFVQTLRPLTAASLQVKDSRDGVLKASDLAYMALKQVLDKVDDQAALKSIVSPMAEALKSDQARRRRYAAHAVMLFGHKVEDKAALWPLVQPLVAAHFHDPDEAARRSAGLALERTFGRTPKAN
jgi:hypothetical protein